MRDLLTSALEVVGAATICYGVFTISTAAGLIVSGVAAIAFGYLAGGPR